MDLRDICLTMRQEIDELEKVVHANLSSTVPFVENVVEYVIHNGGKRLRPILTIITSKLSGYQGKASLEIGAAIEFMHTASLLHDDVIDSAPMRRGRDTTNRKWGNQVSVLVGDFFYCRAMDILVRHGDTKVLRVVTDAVTILTEGEILEITKSNDFQTTQEDYLRIITGKTASLIGAACQCGAILGGVSEEFEHSLKRFGLNLGIAFQLVDDVLDYTAAVEDFGKVNGTDLREGKLTLPLILAISRSTEKDRSTIRKALITDDTSPKEFAEVLRIVEECEGIRDTIKMARGYVDRATLGLASFKPSLEKETLQRIADYVISRKV